MRFTRLALLLVLILTGLITAVEGISRAANPNPFCLALGAYDSSHAAQVDVRNGEIRGFSPASAGNSYLTALTAFQAEEFGANAVSADGLNGAYTWNDPQGIGLGVFVPNGYGKHTRIIPFNALPADLYPDAPSVMGWSADDRYVTLEFVSADNQSVTDQITVAKTLTLLPIQFTLPRAPGGPDPEPMAWSPIGEQFAGFEETPTNIQLVIGSPENPQEYTFVLPPEQTLLNRGPSITWTADGRYAAFFTGDNSQYVDIMGINGKAYNIGGRIERDSMWWQGDVFYYILWGTTDLIAFYPDQNRYQTVQDSKNPALNGSQPVSATMRTPMPIPSGYGLTALVDESNILHITDANGTEVKTIPLSYPDTLLGGWEWCP